MDYARATALLATARDERAGKPLENNTRLVRVGQALAVVLHRTAVVKYWPNGDTSLHTGGWHTVTTKARLNAYSPDGINVWQERGHWYVKTPHGALPFHNGIRFDSTGRLRRPADLDPASFA